MNTQLEAAHAAVPEIAQYHERKRLVTELFRSLPAIESPEAEAQRVADEAVAEYLEGGAWPDDVDERAQAAYVGAIGAQAVRHRVAALHREYTGNAHMTMLREVYRSEILTALGTQLADLLTEARKHTTALGSVRTADEALTAGGPVADAYMKLTPMVRTLTDIRSAQWSAISQGELTGPTSNYERARTSGHGDVQDVNDDTPARQFAVMQTHAYDLDHLVWLAQIRTAFVPDSVEDVLSAQDAYEGRGSVPDDRAITHLSPSVTPHPKPRAPKRAPDHHGEREAVARARYYNH
ncbi:MULTISPECIES: hypothetical protein [unclassified Streptomyces]|uniref:hypothetical protein n=1 Tax=unclassified Streptomyces TaxID=2593676 RepID=UPI003448AFA5